MRAEYSRGSDSCFRIPFSLFSINNDEPAAFPRYSLMQTMGIIYSRRSTVDNGDVNFVYLRRCAAQAQGPVI